MYPFENVNVRSFERAFLFREGELVRLLGPGKYRLWNPLRKLRVDVLSVRDAWIRHTDLDLAVKAGVLDDLAVVLTLADAAMAVSTSEDHRQALYRESQLALRAAVGGRMLDELLTDKDAVIAEVATTAVRERVTAFGLTVLGFGIRDIVLPGEMKNLLNQVIEAQKAAEASLITRREETAAMRNQANTARLLENNPTLMRLRELEVIEKIAAGNKLNVIVGDKGIGERLLNLV